VSASVCHSPGALWASPSCRRVVPYLRAGHIHRGVRTATGVSRYTSRSARGDADVHADGRADVHS